MNVCNSWSWTEVVGPQTASSGHGFSGLYCYYSDVQDTREIIGTKLLAPLVKGEQYYVSVKFSMAEKYPDTGINNLGVLFLTKGYRSTNAEGPGKCPTCLNYLPNYAHVYTTSAITNYTGWTEVSGYFTADSSYTHIAIGNFFDDNNTAKHVVFLNNPGKKASYYFVDDVVVAPAKPPPPVYLGNDTTLCPGQTLILDASNDSYSPSYHWQDNSTGATFQVTGPGTYWVEVTAPGFYDTDSLTVHYIETLNLGNDTSFCQPATITLTANVDADSYLWQDGSTENTFLVIESGTYSVKVNESYCGEQHDTIVVNIEDCEVILDMPNVFTPNGDEDNEVFTPRRIKGVTGMNTSIYNRWGKEVFTSNSLTIGWTGKSSGENDPSSGVYYWTISYTDRNGHQGNLKGIITLLR